MDTCAASSSEDFLLEDDFDAFLTVIMQRSWNMTQISLIFVSYGYAKTQKLIADFNVNFESY